MIETIQPQAPDLGRARIGDKETYTDRQGKQRERPVKLGTFRFTSHDELAIKAIATIYGGEPGIWEDAPEGEQFEVITESNVIQIMLPPDPLSAWFERWSAGGCIRRCTGRKATVAVTVKNAEGKDETAFEDQDCFCASKGLNPGDGDDVKKGACDLVSRLGFIMQEVPGLGLWRLDTGSIFAYREIAGQVGFLQGLAEQGVRNVPADLCIEIRKIKRPGQVTKEFPVPTLRVRKSLSQLYRAAGRELGMGGPTEPVRELESARSSTIGDFPKHIQQVIYETSRSGLTDDQSKALCLAVTKGRTASRKDLGLDDARTILGALATETWQELIDAAASPVSSPIEAKAHVDEVREQIPGRNEDPRERHIHQLQTTAQSLPEEQKVGLVQYLADNNLDADMPDLTDQQLDRVAEAVETFKAEADRMASDEIDWAAEAKAAGVTQAKVLTQAREFAKEAGIKPPGHVREITNDTLVSRTRGWLREHKEGVA